MMAEELVAEKMRKFKKRINKYDITLAEEQLHEYNDIRIKCWDSVYKFIRNGCREEITI
jgi:hypothetical protein